MDTLFHGVLGATLCSRTGLAGGRRGPGPEFKRRWLFSDWTLWAAFFFGIVPDLASLGIHFMMDAFTGNGVRWHGIPDYIFALYGVTHGLAQLVVHRFEIVQIDKHQRAGPAAAAGAVQGLLQALLEHAAVGQTRQRIVVCQMGHRVAAAVEFVHLLADLRLHVAKSPCQLAQLIQPLHRQGTVRHSL